MNLRELIKNVEKKPDSWFDLDPIGYEFDLYNLYVPEGESRIQSYFIHSWYCTDTWVGLRVYFLDDEPVCLSKQWGRKCREEFDWLSEKAIQDTKAYLTALAFEDESHFTVLTEEDLDGELSGDYKEIMNR